MSERHSHSSGSSIFLGWTLVVEIVALSLTSIICFPPYGFDSELESFSDSEYFNSATSDYLKQHSLVLFQEIL
jgi:hypothetical protein